MKHSLEHWWKDDEDDDWESEDLKYWMSKSDQNPNASEDADYFDKEDLTKERRWKVKGNPNVGEKGNKRYVL
jgi:hypothetical protein